MSRAKHWLPTASAILCAALALCYALRADACAAVTFVPAWVWTPPGLALALPGLWNRRRTAFVAALALWVGFTLAFSEEPSSLLTRPAVSHSEFQAARESGRGLRIATLNCAGGNSATAAPPANSLS